MSFWNSNTIEPKRAFRFLLSLAPLDGLGIIASYYVKTAKKPTFQMDGQGEIKYIQHTFKYPGRITWQPIDVTIIDPATPDAAGILMNMLRGSGYHKPDSPENAVQSISKFGANNSMGAVYLSQINADGAIISEWNLVNPFLTTVDFGSLGYDSDEIVEYTLTIDYDYATLKTYGMNGNEVNPGVSHE